MSDTKGNQDFTPLIPSSTSLPEITVKAVILGALLSVMLGAANAYLGLFAGMTVSASIPAAVISMAVLSLFRNSNILENNIVQTAASAGESVAAGVIFTIPGLYLIGAWTNFNYWETTMIAGFGGILGVMFTIPLRRALIVEQPLQFPEGVATAEVLKVGDAGGEGVKIVAKAGLIGALFKFGETGLKLWQGVAETAAGVGNSVLYIGGNLSPALLGVGYIVGFNIATLIFIGGAINWYIFIPIMTAMQGGVTAGTDALTFANNMWGTQTRYLGVGAMLVGGFWALIRLRSSLVRGIKSGMAAYRASKASGEGGEEIQRTDKDTPMQWVGIAVAISVIPLFFIFEHFTGDMLLSAFMAIIMLIAGFLFSSVGGYMSGLVGSSNNPISGVTIATVLTTSLLLLAWLGTGSATGPTSALFIGAVVACGAAIAGDNMQDLKAGRLLGATPVNQQIMQVVGVVAAAFVMAPVLTLLLEAYGIGPSTDPNSTSLAAPQASLMASVANGVFGAGLPWTMVSWGMGLAVVIIILDLYLEKAGTAFRTPVLAVAVGIYLPFELDFTIFLGGIVALVVANVYKGKEAAAPADKKEAMVETRKKGQRNGLLFSAGLITGEALVGILMAIPIVIYSSGEVLAFFGVHSWNFIGMALLAIVIYGVYKISMKPLKE